MQVTLELCCFIEVWEILIQFYIVKSENWLKHLIKPNMYFGNFNIARWYDTVTIYSILSISIVFVKQFLDRVIIKSCQNFPILLFSDVMHALLL